MDYLAPLSPFGGDTALLVIDMQRDFLDPSGYAAQAGLDVEALRASIPGVRTLLEAARRQGLLIIHTREGHRPDLSDCPLSKLMRSVRSGATIGSDGPLGRLLVRGEFGHDFIDTLAPRPGECVIDKPGYSAFHQTDLQQILGARGIRQLILSGVTTEVCVHSTLRSAVDHGYNCWIATDACASADASLHQAALDMVAVEGGIFGEVRSSADLAAAIGARTQELA
ncbi:MULTISPECIES: cysteine hydrolase [unclassified Thiomonas]|jgi:nicotinamidase-related amidase|uniref:cysteine hydrolase family protein n=1 Tax=unclassified Thiomonas TaxID=2625466 RepID=UPI000A6BB4CF|nr:MULTISPECIES: cysteine hydrolase [unclassified Thiomonas]OZB55668.1 MAG: cysteine hydrolase [Thiomonas sp. 15-63-373]OZB69687.1 MAG: cysteine hydrolase [Thiomonas sp. 13-64-67]